ncbi:hypothetical protein [Treponema zioleckii]|uniref:hypothetical protein n=1 Tax=Treponema zioleckii TaxID=331680 RepID=UPI00168B88F3|nr:hypothetical protein [Treponema zioleckii]
MKKIFLALMLILGIATTKTFALGIGIQAGPVVGSGFHSGGAITFKLDQLPCVFAVAIPSFDPFAIGVTADWWMENPTIKDFWKWYYGFGAAGAFYVNGDDGDSSAALGVGGRILIGTNVLLLNDVLELYAQAAWQPMLFVGNGIGTHFFNFPIDIGVRLWF